MSSPMCEAQCEKWKANIAFISVLRELPTYKQTLVEQSKLYVLEVGLLKESFRKTGGSLENQIKLP